MQDRLGDKARVRHVIKAILEIETYIAGVDFDQFAQHSMMFNATLRQLEIIGEASNRISDAVRKENNHIPWASIVSLRNLVIHEYFGVDDLTIWHIIKNDLPELKKNLKAILKNLK